HELSVVFAQRAWRRLVAGIGDVRTLGPLPHVAEKLMDPAALGQIGERMVSVHFYKVALEGFILGGKFPLAFRRKPCAGPPRIRVRLVVAYVADRIFIPHGE